MLIKFCLPSTLLGLENALYGNGVWSMLATYWTVLGLWISVYVAIENRGNAQRRSQQLHKAMFAYVIGLAAFLVIGTTSDILRAYDFHMSAEADAVKSTVILIFYNGMLALFVCVPAIGYYILGRRLSQRLRAKDAMNGIQIEDVHVKRMQVFTTSSIIVAIATFVVITIATCYLAYVSGRPTSNPSFVGAFGLGIHIIYRLGELAYLCIVVGFSYFKLQPKLDGEHYVRMADFGEAPANQAWTAVPTTDSQLEVLR